MRQNAACQVRQNATMRQNAARRIKKGYFNGLNMKGLLFGKIGTRFARRKVYGSSVTPGDNIHYNNQAIQ